MEFVDVVKLVDDEVFVDDIVNVLLADIVTPAAEVSTVLVWFETLGVKVVLGLMLTV